eukprot:4624163-Alexandrium_andersonii.AAC.1
MLDEPEHNQMIHRHLPLDPRLERQHEGADQPFELLDGFLQRAIGLWLVRRRRLRRSLESKLLRHSSAEIH